MKTNVVQLHEAVGTQAAAGTRPGFERLLFALGMAGLGTLALVYGDFAMVWQPVAPWVPGRTALAYGSGVLMLACGAGLPFAATVKWAARALVVYLTAWALLKVPAVVAVPQMEAVWLGLGELTVLLAGGWVLFAKFGALDWGPLTGARGVKWAIALFGASLLPIGLSHLIYAKPTYDLVPAWMPARVIWSYVTGVGQIACGLGVLLRIWPRVAATAEAVMISLFALLCWGPAIVITPKMRLGWTAFWISWAIASAAWVVAHEEWQRQRDRFNW
ncbi:MAG: DoxX family protein [Terracidiphilus sp.]